MTGQNTSLEEPIDWGLVEDIYMEDTDEQAAPKPPKTPSPQKVPTPPKGPIPPQYKRRSPNLPLVDPPVTKVSTKR